ncbi:molybdenum cofactor sulfurase protein-like protein [Rhizodiscina lignyota]|uniref:Molybdenum cofactor sulfurase n=1 Tax=Rhizodiscina lignyota TaxID=1504668 RepID=A0A9P4M683_9PEZI|nr:molybdenum cofactor sulfurase protein-like protein [Rhizodiscina lignyota]
MAMGVDSDYNPSVEAFREIEYPMLKDALYLDHAGTTLYPKSLIERYSQDLIGNLYGNPHSASTASQTTSECIDDVRLSLLQLFQADPDDFDVVFVANATAGIKLVMDAFRDSGNFWYGYHKDAHTSIVGVREAAAKHTCFETDEDVEHLISNPMSTDDLEVPGLFAYPAQSNLNGRRLPLGWCGRLRESATSAGVSLFTLLDAAAFASTSPLDFSNADEAPDFTVLSLYKIFGFPDLGVLLVRKASGGILSHRKYFGGGTVDMVLCLRERWHAKKSGTVHEHLEDGTLPIHNILAVRHALDTHQELFGSLERVSRHTAFLAEKLFNELILLRHSNGVPVCEIYKDSKSPYQDRTTQGPIVAFNIRSSRETWISNAEVEKLAAVKNIQLRTGGLCNPGGIASHLKLEPWEMRRNFSAGQRCGVDDEILDGKPTGMVRLSLGAMSTINDVQRFIGFMKEFFVEHEAERTSPGSCSLIPQAGLSMAVESLTVFPIKSCAGWRVPQGWAWRVRQEGLAWDREWCLVNRSTGAALSQKQHPRMALIRPTIDLANGVLRVFVVGSSEEVAVPLSGDPTVLANNEHYNLRNAKVCGDLINAQVYASDELATFFTRAVGAPCQLARFPAASSSSFGRHTKAHLQPHQREMDDVTIPGAYPKARTDEVRVARPILLSNESPILVITRSSLNRLNEHIKSNGGKAAHAEVFRANIVIAENLAAPPGLEQPYVEDEWRALQIGEQHFQMLGACRRCQMVCVDQETAVKNEEPFATLAKTRRFNGRVFFGQHACHVPVKMNATPADQDPTIMVGDKVSAFWKGVDEEP